MLVKEMMRQPVTVIAAGAPLGEALRLFQAHGFRHLPVLDDARLVGILTDRDLRSAISNLAQEPRTVEDPVALVMSSPVLTADPLDPVEDAARIMRDRRIGCLPVMQWTARRWWASSRGWTSWTP